MRAKRDVDNARWDVVSFIKNQSASSFNVPVDRFDSDRSTEITRERLPFGTEIVRSSRSIESSEKVPREHSLKF
jgi:hypothetical protein